METITEQLEEFPAAGAQAILEHLPERIKQAYLNMAAELNYPIEAVFEMALAGYLDMDAIGFADCKPDRGKKTAA
jgi:hypothetical protein